MIITAIFLIIDWLVLTANDYTFLSYHCYYIGCLVLALWKHKQPERYNINSEHL